MMDYLSSTPNTSIRDINNDSNTSTNDSMKILVLMWIRRVCILLTIAFYGSGLYTSQIKFSNLIHMHKSTEGHSMIPLLTGILNGGLWFNYAIITNNTFTLIASTICYSLNCVYVVIYNSYTEDKVSVANGVKLVLTSLVSVVAYTWLAPGNQGRRRAGEIANFVSILLTSSPLVHLKEVYDTNSNHNMPFTMILIGFTSSLLYIVYGWLIDDVYIVRPNRISGVVTGFQLLVYYLYS